MPLVGGNVHPGLRVAAIFMCHFFLGPLRKIVTPGGAIYFNGPTLGCIAPANLLRFMARMSPVAKLVEVNIRAV